MFGLSDGELQTISDILKSSGVERGVIFGSRAKGTHKKGSDIDIAIIGDEQKVSYMLNEECNLPYFFDVVNMKKINNQNLIDHIHRVGKNIFE